MIYKKSWKYILKHAFGSYYRPIAIKDFKDVKKGDLGGYIQHYHNLSQTENCWIYGGATVYGNARVIEDAIVKDNAQVFGNARVTEDAVVKDNAEVFGNAKISGRVMVIGNRKVSRDLSKFEKYWNDI